MAKVTQINTVPWAGNDQKFTSGHVIWNLKSTSIIRPKKIQQAIKIERPGRNDSCPCGSGKKYKKCHLPA